MELYEEVSYELAEKLTKRYSTSFSMSSQLFDDAIRPHIYAIYGLVRLADEIVDSYRGADARTQLDNLEKQVAADRKTGYSTNPIIHAYVVTANQYKFEGELLSAFFESMRTDLSAETFTASEYDDYIYGSAEVIGLMCLKVFVDGGDRRYNELSRGAKALGRAYQKVNFLRDFAADRSERGRTYFPEVGKGRLTVARLTSIVDDVRADFLQARPIIDDLPTGARRAVQTSYNYYWKLFEQLAQASPVEIGERRFRVPNWYKIYLYIRARLGL